MKNKDFWTIIATVVTTIGFDENMFAIRIRTRREPIGFTSLEIRTGNQQCPLEIHFLEAILIDITQKISKKAELKEDD